MSWFDIEDVANQFMKEKNDGLSNIHHVSAEYTSEVRSKLVNWYKLNRRKMPWRGDDTQIPVSPYGIWISEVMLQQTRVETVISYWNKWMQKYPTISDLAKATPDDVNTLWSGLGYYRRAQNLLLGAKHIVSKHNGEVPQEKKLLLDVPGIGPYTAGAILSIAFKQPEPLVDGNVMRVFSRLFALQNEIGGSGSNSLEKYSWQFAEKLVDPTYPHLFNQGLMELGATVCKPTNPDCSKCPLKETCQAYSLINYKKNLSEKKNKSFVLKFESLPDDISFFPRKKPKKKQKEINLLIYVIAEKRMNPETQEESYRYLLLKRPEKGLLANQWEFPSIEVDLTNKIEVANKENEDEEDETDSPVPVATVSTENLVKDNSSRITSFFLSRCQAARIEEMEELQSSSFQNISYEHLYQSTEKSPLSPPIVHIFSHERHSMYVHVDQVTVISLEKSDSSELSLKAGVCWKTAQEMKEMGITTGCKKILEKVEEFLCPTPMQKSSKKREFQKIKSSEGSEVEEDLIDLTEPTEIKNAFQFMKTASAAATSKKNGSNQRKKAKN
jgi:A/G-specific adenine glycosylase